jgi:hypothetical protein
MTRRPKSLPKTRVRLSITDRTYSWAGTRNIAGRFAQDNRTAGQGQRNVELVQERFPVGWHPSCGSRCGLIFWMRKRRKQFTTFDHPLLLVIEEPVLTRLKAGNDRMSCCRRMLGCMLARRTVAASDVPTLRTPTQMKPPTFRQRQAFHTSVATWS